MGNIGTRKVYETDKLAIWEFFLESGETTELHTHERDYVFYVLEGSTVKVFDATGNEVAEVPVGTGTVMAFKRKGDDLVAEGIEGLSVPATHATQNVGNSRYREILIELK